MKKLVLIIRKNPPIIWIPSLILFLLLGIRIEFLNWNGLIENSYEFMVFCCYLALFFSIPFLRFVSKQIWLDIK
jgi:hypothetical protein